MWTALLGFVGGLFTIVSPCILPIIPLTFASALRRSPRSVAALLTGLATAFTLAMAVGIASARWITSAAVVGRTMSIVVLAGVGLTLLLPRVAAFVYAPVVGLGVRLLARIDPAQRETTSHVAATFGHVATGFAIGLLWAPCAGPILGALVTASVQDHGGRTLVPIAAFAAGAATMLAIAIGGGARVFGVLRHAGIADVGVRRVLGAAVLGTVVLMASGRDQLLFARAGLASTDRVEAALVARVRSSQRAGVVDVANVFHADRSIKLPSLDTPMPEFVGATTWINTSPLTRDSLKGKVVLIDFWTFQCYNCLNALPHVKALYEKYRERGFVVIGVHTPELPTERVVDNVRREVRRLGITYPVVVDNDYRIWNAYHNQYWPAAYYVDGRGEVRYSHFGEGAYLEQDAAVASLLDELRSARGRGTAFGQARRRAR